MFSGLARLLKSKEKRIAEFVDASQKALLADNIDAAMAQIELGAKQFPKSPEIHLQRAAVMLHAAINLPLRAQRLPEVEQALCSFLLYAPKGDPLKKPAGQVLDEVRRETRNWMQLARAGHISVDLSFICQTRATAAMQLFLLKNYAAAAPLCETGYRWEGYGSALLLKINCLKELGQKEAVRQACDQAMKLNERNPEYYNMIGKVLFEDCQAHDAAMECFGKALAIDAKHAPSLCNRGVCRLASGDRAGGRNDLENALKCSAGEERQQITALLGQLDGLAAR